MAGCPRGRGRLPPGQAGGRPARGPPDPQGAPAGARRRRRHHRGVRPGPHARAAQALQGAALPAGDLRFAVRPGRALAGGQGTEGAAGLPRRVPGHRGPAGRDPGVRRPDDGRADRARRHAAGHGRDRGRARDPPAAGAQRVRRPVPRVRQRSQPGPDPGHDRGGRAMKIFATYNIKGGVGKTSTAVNLGYLAARDGYRVLLWDLDPQAEFIAGFDGHRPDILAFFSMIDRRKTLHKEIAATLPGQRSDVAATAIPALSLIEQMSVRRAPVSAFAPRSSAARSYAQLWAEARARGGLSPARG